MKKNLFLVLVLLISLNVFSQNDNIISSTPTRNYLGMSMGVVNNFHNDIINGESFKSTNPLMSLGLVYTRKLSEKMEFSMESNLMIGSISNKFHTIENTYSYEVNSASLSMPISLRYNFNEHKSFNGLPNFIQVGPSFNLNIAAYGSRSVILNKFGNNAGRYYVPFFTNFFEPNLRIGTGYTFKLKYVFMRAEFNYFIGANSAKPNALPFVYLTKTTNDAFGLNIILENRLNKVVYKKLPRGKSNPFKGLFRFKN